MLAGALSKHVSEAFCCIMHGAARTLAEQALTFSLP
jgi:hypothetical protein